MRKTTDYELDELKIFLPLRCDQYRYRYPGQFRSQQAYIELDPEDKTLRCDWNGEIGNAVPFSVYHRRILRFPFNSEMKLKDVRACMKAIAPLCVKLIATYDTDWNGSNLVGKFDYDIEKHIEDIVWDFSWKED